MLSCSVCIWIRWLETSRACGRALRRSFATSARRISKSLFLSVMLKFFVKIVDMCDL